MIVKIKKHFINLHSHIKPKYLSLHAKAKDDWRVLLLVIFVLSSILMSVGQFIYPADRLAVFTVIDGIDLSGWNKQDAINRLNDLYKNETVAIYFGKSDKPYIEPKISDVGFIVDNQSRINNIDYPWYLRIVPTSALWMHFIDQSKLKLNYQKDSAVLDLFISKNLGESCDVKSKNASLIVSGDKFEVLPSTAGGTCDVKDVKTKIGDAVLAIDSDNKITIPVKEVAAIIDDIDAANFGDDLKNKIIDGVTISVNDQPQLIPFNDLITWIDFSEVDNSLTYSFNSDRALEYFKKEIAPKVAISAGTTTVSTHDFTETARVNGANGRRLDINATLDNLKKFIDGGSDQAIAMTAVVAPKTVYNRNYSSNDVGLSALMQQYTQDHPGIFGVSLIEISGLHRRASYNDDKIFVTASTYKLYVAYSTLKRVEEGVWHWGDQITGGRNLAVCLDDMIVRSDNDCGAELLAKVGYTNITNEAHAIGCVDTSFISEGGIKTTPADLALLLAQLKTGQILTQQSSRDKLIDMLSRNIYRQGIPAGMDGIAVADKVGFMDGLLHDAAIVSDPTGDFVLVIMTDGSSWSTIADLTRQIQTLRIQ